LKSFGNRNILELCLRKRKKLPFFAGIFDLVIRHWSFVIGSALLLTSDQ